MPATVARPSGSGPWPAIVFVNGATRRGRQHPDVQRLARGLARAGYLTVVPDLPGLPLGEISTATVDATVDVAAATADDPRASDGRVSLLGVSVGGTLALLAAESPELAERVRVVAALAPYTSLRKVIRLATTGTYVGGTRYDADPYVRLAVGRSLAAGVRGPDGAALLAALEAVDDEDPRPLARLRSSPPPLRTRIGRVVLALLLNREASRSDRLYARLPRAMRAYVSRLSPLDRARWLRARVELASAPDDKYFPIAESRALERAATGAHVSVTATSTLSHALPEPSFGSIADLFRFNGFVVRVLKEARE
jgi:pimeloyl-ACP methyl ester carboxylesterase